MNQLYDTIITRCKARIKETTPISEFEGIWFAVAEEYLKELKTEGLVETVKELQSIIDLNKKYVINKQ